MHTHAPQKTRMRMFTKALFTIILGWWNVGTYKIRWWWFSHSVVSNSCDPMDYSPPGSSVHGVSQARILEWVAISSSSRDLPAPVIEPTPPELQVGSLLLNHQGSSLNKIYSPFNPQNL